MPASDSLLQWTCEETTGGVCDKKELSKRSLNIHSGKHVTQTPEVTNQTSLSPLLSALTLSLLRCQTFQRRSSLVETRRFRQQKGAEVPKLWATPDLGLCESWRRSSSSHGHKVSLHSLLYPLHCASFPPSGPKWMLCHLQQDRASSEAQLHKFKHRR